MGCAHFMEPKKTPLYDEHLSLGGKMADFAGWMLPLWYPSGQVAEHNAVRNACGLFDICHMGEFEIRGGGAQSFLEEMLTNRVHAMTDRQAMYHFLLNERGGVIDDCILYRFDAAYWMLVVNAGNIHTDFEWLSNHAPSRTTVVDISNRTVKLDLQGPQAPRLLSEWIPKTTLAELRFFHFIHGVRINGMEVLVSRTGYTGEIGFELYTDLTHARALWQILLEKGRAYGLLPCGLGARDTLRLEAGLPLHGHELRPDRAALGHPWEFAISWDHVFFGKKALSAYREDGIRYWIIPFRMDGKRKAMPGWQVRLNGEMIGSVLSGVISPTLGNVPIGFMEVNRTVEKETPLLFCPEDNTTLLEGRVWTTPFIPPTSRRKITEFLT